MFLFFLCSLMIRTVDLIDRYTDTINLKDFGNVPEDFRITHVNLTGVSTYLSRAREYTYGIVTKHEKKDSILSIEFGLRYQRRFRKGTCYIITYKTNIGEFSTFLKLDEDGKLVKEYSTENFIILNEKCRKKIKHLELKKEGKDNNISKESCIEAFDKSKNPGENERILEIEDADHKEGKKSIENNDVLGNLKKTSELLLGRLQSAYLAQTGRKFSVGLFIEMNNKINREGSSIEDNLFNSWRLERKCDSLSFIKAPMTEEAKGLEMVTDL